MEPPTPAPSVTYGMSLHTLKRGRRPSTEPAVSGDTCARSGATAWTLAGFPGMHAYPAHAFHMPLQSRRHASHADLGSAAYVTR